MKLEQSFEVAAPVERVWDALIDVEKVAPCLPGAAVTGRNDDGSYDGSFSVKIGPTSASYTGKLLMEEVDEQAHRAKMQANGTDRRGQGSAKATIVSTVSAAAENRTQVEVVTEYHITGRLARFGRGGMIEDISEKLLRQFAARLQQMLESGGDGGGGGGEADGGSAVTSDGAGEGAGRADGEAPGDAEATGDEAGDEAGEADGELSPEAEQTSVDLAPPTLAETRVLPQPPPNEPVQGLSLMGSVLWARLRRNPIPAAFIAGLLLAFALLGRRRRD